MFDHPNNLMMSLVELLQFALLIGLFIWFMNWPRRPTIWELQKKQREKFRALYKDDPPNSAEPVKHPTPAGKPSPDSN